MYAIQGAMAIRRQRQMRENRRLSQIRMSIKSGRKGSQSPRGSDAGSIGPEVPLPILQMKGPPKAETSQTAFYLGVVFILLGFLMIFSSMISNSSPENNWSNLLGVGVTFLLVGLIMVMVNRIITAREEEELTRYVSHRLGRSRSGHTLVRDAESGEDFHHHQQRCYRQQMAQARSPRPVKSPRDKPVDPFPKFRQGSQVSTRAGSTRTSPVVPGPKSIVPHSNSHQVQNGKHVENGHPVDDVTLVDELADVVKCPIKVSVSSSKDNLSFEHSNKHEENDNCVNEPNYASETTNETDALLKTHKSNSVKKVPEAVLEPGSVKM